MSVRLSSFMNSLYWNVKKGAQFLLISFELEEILQVSDRIAVLYEGRTVAFLDPKETNEIELGFLMAGGKKEEVGRS